MTVKDIPELHCFSIFTITNFAGKTSLVLGVRKSSKS